MEYNIVRNRLYRFCAVLIDRSNSCFCHFLFVSESICIEEKNTSVVRFVSFRSSSSSPSLFLFGQDYSNGIAVWTVLPTNQVKFTILLLDTRHSMYGTVRSEFLPC
uniref:Uncharacterized protein n=1 Tax=Pseudo-nitzschia australis TaxID=44445 RepID=A0A7S4ATM0_9STRA